jgi:galactose mutarotase-like enzyme
VTKLEFPNGIGNHPYFQSTPKFSGHIVISKLTSTYRQPVMGEDGFVRAPAPMSSGGPSCRASVAMGTSHSQGKKNLLGLMGQMHPGEGVVQA